MNDETTPGGLRKIGPKHTAEWLRLEKKRAAYRALLEMVDIPDHRMIRWQELMMQMPDRIWRLFQNEAKHYLAGEYEKVDRAMAAEWQKPKKLSYREKQDCFVQFSYTGRM